MDPLNSDNNIARLIGAVSTICGESGGASVDGVHRLSMVLCSIPDHQANHDISDSRSSHPFDSSPKMILVACLPLA